MNLVGKIFTVLIFVMCIVFSSFALMLHAGHKNWRDEYVKQTAQLDKANEEKAKLQQAYKLLDQQRTNDNDRDKKLIASMQAAYDILNTDNLNANTKNMQLQGDLRKFAADFKLVAQTLADIRREAESLRTANTVVVDERQKVFDNLVKATTDVTNLGAEIARLEKLGRDVAEKYNREHMLTQYKKDQPSDMQQDPPAWLTGLVTGVRQSDVEISLGYDDGIRPGHTFRVTRPNTGQYVGDIVVKQVPYPNRAVGSAVKETMRDHIEKYDHVQANLTKRSQIGGSGR
jgi:hypothetical protein